MAIELKHIIAPSFYSVHHDIANGHHTHYWLKGGRGSTKSSFISVELVLGIMRDAAAGEETNAIIFRRYGVTIRESVYEQILWAIGALGVSRLWKASVSPMSLVYTPTGQKIIFRGADDATKIKSVKAGKGYFKYAWYEEANEFEGPEKLRSINQSVMRGGQQFVVFYSFNPPKSLRSWVNQYVTVERADTLVHHSTYLQVPAVWLGAQFHAEAEHLKRVKPEAYAHEYLGEAVGTGGDVFANLRLETIADEDIGRFDKIRRGLDWGYAADPLHYALMHFDSARRRLYIFGEVHRLGQSNRAMAEYLGREMYTAPIICDSAEPKSIADLRAYGLRVDGAKKGPDSVEYGIKFLQDLEAIIIDPKRCPNTAREFSGYELERDREGNFKAGFPDKDNHSIDAVRYALERDMRRPAMRVLK